MKKALEFHRLLLIFILFLFTIPAIESTFNIVNVKPLNGTMTSPRDTALSLRTWFSGEYQQRKTKMLNDSFGFRNILVRTNNQIDYSLFNKASAKNIVVGKMGYLFGVNQIRAFSGEDFIGVDSISRRMGKLKFLQDTLLKLHKTLIIIFAPGKGSFYPEYIPDKYKSNLGPTNYQCYLEFAKRLGLNYIDFNNYFLTLKKQSQYPLFPQYGIHWSIYGACIAGTYLIKYLEKIQQANMLKISWDGVEQHYPQGSDEDAEADVNLLFGLKEIKMGYPKIKIEPTQNMVKPITLFICDSYFNAFARVLRIGNAISPKSHFWLYGKEVYPESYSRNVPLQVGKERIKDEILKNDFIIIMTTDFNLPNFGWGIIEAAYKQFYVAK